MTVEVHSEAQMIEMFNLSNIDYYRLIPITDLLPEEMEFSNESTIKSPTIANLVGPLIRGEITDGSHLLLTIHKKPEADMSLLGNWWIVVDDEEKSKPQKAKYKKILNEVLIPVNIEYPLKEYFSDMINKIRTGLDKEIYRDILDELHVAIETIRNYIIQEMKGADPLLPAE